MATPISSAPISPGRCVTANNSTSFNLTPAVARASSTTALPVPSESCSFSLAVRNAVSPGCGKMAGSSPGAPPGVEGGTLDEYNLCLQERNDQRIRGGGIAMGGAAVAITGLVLGTGRPGAEELRHWAAEHNRAHGIPPIAGAPARVRIGTAIDRHGAGLVVSGRF